MLFWLAQKIACLRYIRCHWSAADAGYCVSIAERCRKSRAPAVNRHCSFRILQGAFHFTQFEPSGRPAVQ